MHEYEVRPRKDQRGVDLISEALPFGRLWYDGRERCQQRNRLRQPIQSLTDAVIRVYDEAGNVIETHEHAGHFKDAS